MIFFLIGKGGSGKDTILAEVLKQFEKEANSKQSNDDMKKYMLKRLVTYTTRPMREGEQDGVEYYFVDKKKFKAMKRAKQVVEYRKYKVANGDTWCYFTARDEQLSAMHDLILVGPLKQYEQLNKHLGTPVIPIYIKIDEKIRKKRMYKRESQQENPNYAEVERRLAADEKDFEGIEKINGLIEIDNNGSLKSTVATLTRTINNLLDSYYMLKAEVLGIRTTDSQTVTEFTLDEEKRDSSDK